MLNQTTSQKWVFFLLIKIQSLIIYYTFNLSFYNVSTLLYKRSSQLVKVDASIFKSTKIMHVQLLPLCLIRNNTLQLNPIIIT